jgi:lipopolysaccharide transport system ATP-binding protein
MASIRVRGLGKFYKRYDRPSARLSEWLSLGRLQRYEPVWVLRNLSFELQAGDALAIVGRNGAGKSSLLRLLNGTLNPSEGELEVKGRVAAMELGLRFHGESTGRQNLFIAGQVLGLSSDQIAELLPEITAFSELADHLDQPIRTYSSGMRLRLAFSIATAVRPDVLLVDEALAVGDARFQQRCVARIRLFLEQGSCLVFVSHDPQTVRSLCSRALLLEDGRKLREGSPAAVLDYYNALLARLDENHDIEQAQTQAGAAATRSGEGQVSIESIELLGGDGPERSFPVGSPLRVRVRGRAHQAVADLTVGVAICDRLGNHVYGTNSYHLEVDVPALEPGEVFDAEFQMPANLAPDPYTVTAALHAGRVHLEGSYDWWDHALAFEVVPGREPYFVGRAYLPVTLRFEKLPAEVGSGGTDARR